MGSIPNRGARGALSAAGAAIFLLLGASALAQSDPPPEPPPEPLLLDIPDSLTTVRPMVTPRGTTTDTTQTVRMATVVVPGTRVRTVGTDGQQNLGRAAIDTRDIESAADVAPLLASTRVAMNSRGEAQFMVRGASERHVPVFLDGLPVTIPWDERVDLSMVPSDALGGLRVIRGFGSVLDGPNSVGGSVHLLPLELPRSGGRTQLTTSFGEAESWRGSAFHVQQGEKWSLLAGATRRSRDAVLLAADAAVPFNQSNRNARTNSDLEQTSGLLRVARNLPGGGWLRLSLLGSDGSKGVPPEAHVEDARFWRYPEIRRGLAGLSFGLRPRGGQVWQIDGGVSLDFFRQEIREFADATYTTPDLSPGADFEIDRDRTVYGKLRVSRALNESSRLAVGGVLRSTRHRETLVVDGPEETYSQVLSSIAAEYSTSFGQDWHLAVGAGYERAATPDTGDKPERSAETAPLWGVRLRHRVARNTSVYASAFQRERFPSLREMFSGALGRFVPNPSLGPERQRTLELGASRGGRRVDVSVAAFGTLLNGGIEKAKVEGSPSQFERINVDDLRILGVEMLAAYRPMRGVIFSGSHTFLHARRKIDGSFDGFVEDRPAFQSSFAVKVQPTWGLRIQAEGIFTGPRRSLDASNTESDFTRLDADARFNLRLAYRRFLGTEPLWNPELFVRLDNVFDAATYSQVGLPEAGRTLLVGLRLGLDQ